MAGGSGAAMIGRAAGVLLDSNDPIETAGWGDGGIVSGIQPTGYGPACVASGLATNNGEINVNHGAAALLLAGA